MLNCVISEDGKSMNEWFELVAVAFRYSRDHENTRLIVRYIMYILGILLWLGDFIYFISDITYFVGQLSNKYQFSWSRICDLCSGCTLYLVCIIDEK